MQGSGSAGSDPRRLPVAPGGQLFQEGEEMTESLLIGLGGLVLATLCHRILFAKCIVHEYEA